MIVRRWPIQLRPSLKRILSGDLSNWGNMNDTDKSKERRRKVIEDLEKQVGAKESRKMKGRREKDRSIWFGLGMFGLIGWSGAIPTLIVVAAGIWADTTWHRRFSWTRVL